MAGAIGFIIGIVIGICVGNPTARTKIYTQIIQWIDKLATPQKQDAPKKRRTVRVIKTKTPKQPTSESSK